MKRAKFLAAAVLAALSLASVAVGRHYFGPKGRLAFDPRVSSRAMGSPHAPLWLVEYLDFQCQSCRTAASMLHKAIEDHPGQIYLQVRYHPLMEAHRHALKAAVLAECAARQKKFWPLHDELFENQALWSDTENPDAFFKHYAQKAGLDLKRLEACEKDSAVKKAVIDENEEGMALGVSITPTVFLNGKIAAGVPAISAALDEYFRSEKGAAS